jgi:hypothetical protein
MLTIAGGILLSIALLFALLVLIAIPFRIWDRITTRSHNPKPGREDCPICHGSGQQEQTGGNMRFHIQCPSCFPTKQI